MNQRPEISAGYLSSLWKFFASIKLTVVVLLSLAVLSVIGTLIPQNQSPDQYFRAFGPFLYQVLTTLDIFDMYRSWWFQLLIVALVVNIVVCSIDRLRYTGKIIFTKNPSFNLKGFRRRSSRMDFSVNNAPQEIKTAFQQAVARQFSYCRIVPEGEGYAITAEKGRWTRLGVYGVHLSVVILLLGALVGSMLGFEGYVNIAEGETAESIQLRYSGLEQKLPFAIHCEDFDVQFYDTGAPKEFRSQLIVMENGQPSLKKSIIVNDPLRYKGINIFQSSYGKLDGQASVTDLSKPFELNFQSVASGKAYSLKTSAGQPLQLPEDLGTFIVTGLDPNAKFKNMEIGPSVKGTLTPKTGDPLSLLLPLNYPNFDKMRQGKVVITLGQDIVVNKDRYYTGLQVTKDPGVWLVYIGFTMMILGCMVTFFMSHQQVVVEVQPQGDASGVMVSGTANKNKLGLQNRLKHLADKLAVL